MRGTIRQLGALTAVVVAGLVLPSLAVAQETPEVLEARAALNTNFPHGIAKAGQMLVKAAQLRAPDDPIAVSDLLAAASVLYQTGSVNQARTVAEQAGDRALAMGDVSSAARAFNMVALIANQQRDPVRDKFIARAQLLASSPLLSTNEKRRIVSQFQPTSKPTVQVAAKNQ